MTSPSKRKGSSFELSVAKDLAPIYPGAKRGLGQARSAGEVPDVDGTPWWIECKHYARKFNPAHAFAQAEHARSVASEHMRRAPILVIIKQTHVAPMAHFYLNELLAVLDAGPAQAGIVDGMKGPIVSMAWADALQLIREVASPLS